MSYDFAKYAEAIAVAARKGVQVEILWQKHLEEELRQEQLVEMEKAANGSLSKAS